MNPARSFVPALASGVLGNLWLYWSATFVGTSIVALLARNKFTNGQIKEIDSDNRERDGRA